MGRSYVDLVVAAYTKSGLISRRSLDHGIGYLDRLLGSEPPPALPVRRRAPSLRYTPIHVLWLFLGQSLQSAAATTRHPPLHSLLTPIQTGVVRGYLYILGLTLAKLSLLLFLYRIFRVDSTFRVLSWILGTILAIWTTVSLLLCIFACRPIKASWVLSVQLDPRTTCPIKAYEVNNIHGICNIITDFALLILPAPMVFKLRVNGKKKLGLVVVFGTGILYATPPSLNYPYLVLIQHAVSVP